MANVKRKRAYQKAHEAMTAMTLLTLRAVQEIQAGQKLHPSRQGAYAKRANKMLREVMRQAEEATVAMRPVTAFLPYERRTTKK